MSLFAGYAYFLTGFRSDDIKIGGNLKKNVVCVCVCVYFVQCMCVNIVQYSCVNILQYR